MLYQQGTDPRSLYIKQIIFEHFVFPYKLNPQILSQLNSTYITVEQFKEIAQKHLPSQDAEIIFLFHQLALDGTADRKPVEVKSLSLFLALQSYNQAGRHSFFENVNISDLKYQERQRQNVNTYSPLNSPRAKTMRVQSQQTEIQHIVQFVKNNTKDFVTLISSGEIITAQEYNYFSLFLYNEQKSLSQTIFDKTTRLGKDIVAEWTTKNISSQDTIYSISGFTKSVTIKANLGNQDIKISQCDDSMIYIDCTVNTLSISQCTNCQIFVSAVKLITSITSCEKITICVASNYLRICNTIDSTIHYFGSFAPIIYGDCRNIVLGPHNANTQRLLQHLKETTIPISKFCIDKYQKPIVMGQNRIDWSLLPIEEFGKFVLPEQHFGCVDSPLIIECNFDLEKIQKEATDKRILAQQINYERIVLPLLAPPEYSKVVYERYQLFANFQASIKQANLKDDASRMLQNAIQGNFKEWLVQSGSIKNINDLVKLIDQDQ